TRAFARPLRIGGLSNLSGLRGGLILAANHQSHADTALMLAALPNHLRKRLVIAAAADVMASNGLVEAVGKLLFGALPFVRRGLALSSLRQAVQLVREGWVLLIYPEGHLVEGAGEDGDLKAGVALIAQSTAAPVVPVLIAGTQTILPPEARWPRRSPAGVSFGPPLRFESRTRAQFVEDLRQAIQA